MTTRILILGGTTEARELSARLAGVAGVEATLSLAGRTREPAAQALPVRRGGFGGADGLAGYLRDNGISLLIDATHPFAAQISANAARAAEIGGVALLALSRPEWQPQAGDRWTEVETLAEAAMALGAAPRRVLLAVGRQEVATFEAAPQHFYLVRSVDPVEPVPALPRALYILSRGPFGVADETALVSANAIDTIVCKNSGGDATYAKIAAARDLGLEVIMVRRPAKPGVPTVSSVAEAAAHVAASAKRGE